MTRHDMTGSVRSWLHDLVFACLMFLGACLLLGLAVVALMILKGSQPQIGIDHLDAKSFAIYGDQTDAQVVYSETITVREPCIGWSARGFVRLENDGSISDQILTNAQAPGAITPSILRSAKGQKVIISTATETNYRPERFTVHVRLPLPSVLDRGPGWHFADIVAHESCGWFHGELPIHIEFILGPEIDWQHINSAPEDIPSGGRPDLTGKENPHA